MGVRVSYNLDYLFRVYSRQPEVQVFRLPRGKRNRNGSRTYADVMKDIINFIYDNGGEPYQTYTPEQLRECIEKHLEYGTLLRLDDPKGIVAIGRGNWIDSETAMVLDCIIRPDYRSIRTLKYLIDLFVKKNPRCKKILYHRYFKGDPKVRELNIKEKKWVDQK